MSAETSHVNARRRRIPVGLILAFVVLQLAATYLYGTARYQGDWNENDTSVLTDAIEFAQDSGTILRASWTYPNGLAYQSVGLFISELSGLSPTDVQRYALPLLASLIPIAAFAAYRALTGSESVAILAVIVLILQPDFLFVTWRGSHEKFTWLLTLTLIYVLARSFYVGVQERSIAAYMIAFYFIAFSLISTNAFFASSFIAALALSFVTGLVWVRLRRSRVAQDQIRGNLSRLILVSLVCFLFLYVFFFYIFPPARQLLFAFRSLLDSLNALFFARDPSVQAADAYGYLDLAYVAPYVYVILSSLSFALLGFSALVWLLGARGLLFRPLKLDHIPRLFLWLLYVAFSIQLVLSLFADRSAAMGSNLQVRLFTPLMIIVVPVGAIGMHQIMRRLWPHRRTFALTTVAGAAALAVFSLFAIAKFTNEPLVNNNWLYTTQSEQRAGEWTVTHSTRALIWEGWIARIRFPVAYNVPDINPGIFTAGLEIPYGSQYFIWSVVEESRWVRAGLTVPSFTSANRVYDNGDVQVFHRVPTTIYQR